MILIISDENDASTNDVIDWLNYFKKDFFRVNDTSTFQLIELELNTDKVNVVFSIDGTLIELNKITSCWYRRGDFNQVLNQNLNLFSNQDVKNEVFRHLRQENENLQVFYHFLLSKIKHLNNGNFHDINKLYALHQAREVGLDIPSTTITGNKQILQTFYNKNESIITKAIHNSSFFKFLDKGIQYSFVNYTNEIKSDFINNIDDDFFYSLFQEKLKKDYEIRIFYINEKCFSMAIFSQLDKQTSVDFRVYNVNKPNRKIPVLLPAFIEKKIIQLMKLLDRDCCSLDFVVTTDNRYVFLELNPIGQFSMVSYPCNYQLEKEIATYLN